MNEVQQPTIGRTVHYTNLGDKDGKYPPEIQAAIITGVYHQAPGGDETGEPGAKANEVTARPNSLFVDLKVFYRTGLFDTVKVPYSPEPKRGHWNYPPRT